MLRQESLEFLNTEAKRLRNLALEMAYESGGGQHLGGGLSIIDMVIYIYRTQVNIESIKNIDENATQV